MWIYSNTIDILRNKLNLMWIRNLAFSCMWYYPWETLGLPSYHLLVTIHNSFMWSSCSFSQARHIPLQNTIIASAENHGYCQLIRPGYRRGSYSVVPWVPFPLKTCKLMTLFISTTHSTYTGETGESLLDKGGKTKST